MPFGLTNKPDTIMNPMNTIFREYMRVFTLIFIDDILVFYKNKKQHKGHLEEVFEVLRKHNLYAKKENANFLYSN